MPTLDFTNRQPLEERNKLPDPTNAGLAKLFAAVDKVLIKDKGVNENKAMSDKVLLTITGSGKIQTFHEFLAIDEENVGFYCMCLGTYALELYSGHELKATIGFHHGTSIRYHFWDGDAELAKSDDLLGFLAAQGFSEPLAARQEERNRMNVWQIAKDKWLDTAPATFTKYWNQINSLDEEHRSAMIHDLDKEIPDPEKLIIILLQTLGQTTSFWSGYPVYEELPKDILTAFELSAIIEAYLKSDRNDKTRRGLGRFLCSLDFKKTREKQLRHIPHEVIDDLIKCFNQIGEQRGIEEMLQLQEGKNKSLM